MRHTVQYQSHFDDLPTMTVELHNIGEIQALLDTGEERSALQGWKAVQRDILSWNRNPLLGFGGETYPISEFAFDLKYEVGIKPMQYFPVNKDLPADLIFETNVLLDREYSILIEDGSVPM